MTQPWATLRALGLYKQKDADWGIDYVTSGSMRIANEDNGFRLDELENYISRGGFPYLPKFLHGQINDKEGWREYYLDTLLRCEGFMRNVNIWALGGYFVFHLLLLIVGTLLSTKEHKRRPLRRFRWALVRLLITHSIVYGLYLAAVHHVDSTDWAKDIQAGRRYTNPFVITDNEYTGVSTYPYREDVLIETRYKTRALAMYNDFVNAHPGNRAWKSLLEFLAPLYVSYGGLPKVFREQLSEYLVGAMESQQRRFLYQSSQAMWLELSRDDALYYNDRQLKIHSNPVLANVYRELEFLTSDYKYGNLRESAMVRYDVIPYLREFGDKLLRSLEDEEDYPILARLPRSREGDPVSRRVQLIRRSVVLSKPELKAGFVRRPVNLKVGIVPGEPEPGAWIKEGDTIEARYKVEGSYKWYYATTNHIAAAGWFHITYHDGQETHVRPDAVRPYQPLTPGENVEVWIEDAGQYLKAEVLRVNQDGTVDVMLKDDGGEVNGIDIRDFRRPNKKAVKKRRKTQYY
jgi:hypothetical protein